MIRGRRRERELYRSEVSGAVFRCLLGRVGIAIELLNNTVGGLRKNRHLYRDSEKGIFMYHMAKMKILSAGGGGVPRAECRTTKYSITIKVGIRNGGSFFYTNFFLENLLSVRIKKVTKNRKIKNTSKYVRSITDLLSKMKYKIPAAWLSVWSAAGDRSEHIFISITHTLSGIP